MSGLYFDQNVLLTFFRKKYSMIFAIKIEGDKKIGRIS
jgi:hypothetical protein